MGMQQSSSEYKGYYEKMPDHATFLFQNEKEIIQRQVTVSYIFYYNNDFQMSTCMDAFIYVRH